MSGYSLSRLVTRGCAALSLLAAGVVRADFIQDVTATQGLAAAAAAIKTTVNSGTHVVRFSAYNVVGRFKLESPPARVDTLVFERNAALQSDSALLVSGDTAFLEIKNMRSGTLVLRGLAFNLATPDARILAGAEPGKENFHLLIDSCFIFGDNNASSFLTWLGAAGSKVEIRRSFFVFKTGNALQSKAILTSTNLTLANNLLHFGGQVSGTVLLGGLFDFRSNTVHRTQLKLTSESFQGARYEINRNFIGHRGSVDAFGGADPYFLWAANFHPDDSYVRKNRILRSWKGFDHPGTNPPLFGDASNEVRDTTTVKPAGELWDWYGPTGTIDSTGFAFGRDRRNSPYDVFPGATSASIMFEGNPGKAHFRPAGFPRELSEERTPMALPAVGVDSLRFHSPAKGALRLGSFQVDSIVLGMATGFGRAQLLSSDSTYQFRPQRIVSPFGAPAHAFPNDFLPARYFFIAFKGNTPKGTQVSPDRTSSLGTGDTLNFGTVDSAGYTQVFDESLQGDAYPDSLRNLGRNLKISTSASLSGAMVFGSTENGTKPFWNDQVFWWRPKDSALFPAPRLPGGKFVSIAAAAPVFSVFLVEKINVKRGRTTVFPLARGGQVRATSATGFQLRIDSLYVPDSLRFGNASRGYSLAFAGRQPGDSLILKLPGGPETEVFRVAGNPFPTAPSTVDSLGFHSVAIAPGDSNVRLFSGIRYNVIAGQDFDDTLGGVRISGLKSTSSGKIAILPFNEALLIKGIGTADTLPSNSKFRGGMGIRTLSLDLPAPWSASLPVAKAADPTRLAAYAWDGAKWRPLPPPVLDPADSLRATLSGLAATDQAAAVLELLKPASEYVRMDPVLGDRTVSVTVSNINDVHQPIKGFTLRVIHVNEFGTVDTLSKGPVAVGQTAVLGLAERSGLFAYAVIYHTADGDYGHASFTPITTFSWNPARMSVGGKAEKAGKQWHLIGSPYRSAWGRTLTKGQISDTAARDTTDVLKLKSVNGGAAWDPVLKPDTLQLNPGDAFLVNSARVRNHVVDDSATFLLSGEHALGPHAGWRFISPPYPMTFLAAAVRTNNRVMGTFLELKVEPLAQPIDGRVRDYSWVPTDKLKAFTGYAYLFAEGEVLTFSPWSALTPPPPLAKGAPLASSLGAVQVTLGVEGRTRSMRLLAGGGIREIPYLRAPGAGLEMRVGDQGGWFQKRVDDILGIDEPVIIRSPAESEGRLGFSREGLPAQRRDWQARLLHPASGQVLDPAGGFALAKGEHEYRLVAGSEAFLAERISAFRSGIPAGLVLSQNFPNPFRARTRIAVDWPALSATASGTGQARQGRIEVFDARGRRVHALDMGPIRAGRQVVTVDASRWEPGLYTYRLTVAAGGSRVRLQRKMLVTP